jgi:transcriptional regulator with XRE-family HTH domain|nr:MAG TPA: intron associated endonuclease [Caudoviricetes sp.]
MYNAILKYGWENIEHNILFENLTQEEAQEKEKELIAQYKTNIRRYGDDFGYNLTDGGEGTLGHFVPESLKQKSKDRLLGKTGKDCPNSRPVICDGTEYESLTDFKEKNENPKGDVGSWLKGIVGMPKYWYDKKLYYKDLGFEVVKLSKFSEKRNRKVAVGDIIFNNLEECGEYLGVTASSVSLYLNNKETPPQKIINSNLRYEDEDFHIFKESTPGFPGRKIKYECEGITFESQKKLAEYLGVKPGTLNAWLKGKNPMPEYIINKNINCIE